MKKREGKTKGYTLNINHNEHLGSGQGTFAEGEGSVQLTFSLR
jgi:hypothetical protein